MAVTRDCKRSYGQDTALLQTRVSVFWMVVLVAVLIGLPWITSGYLLTILIFCGINCIAALGLNLLTGYTGQISLGHSAFIAVGAYSYAVLAGRAGLPFYLALPLAALISAAVGLVVGLPSLRLKGFYLAIATLGFNFIAEHVLYHWTSMTRGPDGIQIPRPRECWGVLQSDRGVYYLVVGCLVLLMVYMRNLLRSKAGRAFVAIRDTDISARVIGIDRKHSVNPFRGGQKKVAKGGILFGTRVLRLFMLSA